MAQNGASTGSSEGNGAGPFGMGQAPGVRMGEGNGTGEPRVFGPQNLQHGSGAVGATPNREATGDAADWANVFAQFNGEVGEGGGKRSKGVDGGRSRLPMLGKFGVKTQRRRG